MVTTQNKRISAISRQFICIVLVVIITLPGSYLIAGNSGKPNSNFDEGRPALLFRVHDKTTQLRFSAVEAENRIKSFFHAENATNALFTHFNGVQKSPSAEWLLKAERLKTMVLENKFNMHIQLLPSSDMNFMMAAFVPKGADGLPIALINRNWLGYGITDEALTRVIIEQSGFAFDHFLNGENDTAGNEGKTFANMLSAIYEDTLPASVSTGFIVLGGKRLVVEF